MAYVQFGYSCPFWQQWWAQSFTKRQSSLKQGLMRALLSFRNVLTNGRSPKCSPLFLALSVSLSFPVVDCLSGCRLVSLVAPTLLICLTSSFRFEASLPLFLHHSLLAHILPCLASVCPFSIVQRRSVRQRFKLLRDLIRELKDKD